MCRSLALAVLLASVGCAHTVTFDTHPSGAEVAVDGKVIGTTPVQFQDEGSTGKTYQVTVKKQGYMTKQLSLEQKMRPATMGAAAGAGAGGCCVVGGAGLAASLVFAPCLFVGPVGLAAGVPLVLKAWQLPEESYVWDLQPGEGVEGGAPAAPGGPAAPPPPVLTQ